MYTITKTLGLYRAIGSQWSDTDLSNSIVSTLYSNYSKVIIVLHNSITNENINVDISYLRQLYYNYTGTLSDLVLLLGNTTYETIPSLPSTKINYIKYSDAFRSMYKVDLTIAGVITPDNYPNNDKHDLLITRPNFHTDLSLLHDYCLLSVNGYYHMTDSDSTNTFILKGADTMRRSSINHVGILSFLGIGKVSKIPISNIVGQTDNSPLKEKVYFTTNTNTINKSVILVLGGYLVMLDGIVFNKVGDNSFSVDLNKLSYIERICESRRSIDLSSLLLTDQTISTDVLNLEEAWSDDVIRRYFSLPQSYLVVIDTANLLFNRIPIKHSDIPGIFTSYKEPKYPLIVGYGKSVEYWKTFEDGHWNVSVHDSYYRNYIFAQQALNDNSNITDHLVPNMPYEHSRGYLLEMMGYN